MDAVVSVPGAEPWSAPGRGARGRVGVIVTHGFTANPRTMRPLGLRVNQSGFAVEVPLLPGHGTHHRDLATTRYDDWYDAVVRVLEHVRRHADQVVIVGHSLGGTLGLDLATRRPADVDAVAVINPQILDRRDLASRLAPLAKHVVRYVPRELAGLASDDIALPGVTEGAYRIVPSKAAHSLLSQLPRLRGQLPGLVQPLLVVRSPRDHVVASDDAVALIELAGTSSIREVVCERSYHLPQIDYDRAKVEDAVVDFVAEVTGHET